MQTYIILSLNYKTLQIIKNVYNNHALKKGMS